ncbi:GerMN domain-containing protein [Bacillus sp. FSL K6-3431]|uniref:GerMN domain-containing protein n=1 Tax=Bacillus sp. FSL K6-3431 TaxID=2921500 RepID=UPI0030F72096
MAKRTYVAALVIILATSIFSAGCGLIGKDKEKIDPQKEVSHLKEGENLEATPDTAEKETAGEEATDTMMTDLYLIDRNGLVVSQRLSLPKTESRAKQALEHLVAEGPVTEMLPNGFRTVLPAGTEVDVDIKDGKAVVDFSEEFTKYEAKDEQKILQAVTWTLTQFDSVESVELRVNGYVLEEMPVDGTPISKEGLSRADGINTQQVDLVDITNSRPLTLYYLAQASEDYYYVPVTRRVSNNQSDDLTAVINELIEGPSLQTALFSGLGLVDDVKLLDEPKVEKGNVTLNFNEAVLGSSGENVIADEVLQSLVLSLTEQKGIESVSIMVNGKSELMNEAGETLTAPVTRPEKINAGSF